MFVVQCKDVVQNTAASICLLNSSSVYFPYPRRFYTYCKYGRYSQRLASICCLNRSISPRIAFNGPCMLSRPRFPTITGLKLKKNTNYIPAEYIRLHCRSARLPLLHLLPLRRHCYLCLDCFVAFRPGLVAQVPLMIKNALATLSAARNFISEQESCFSSRILLLFYPHGSILSRPVYIFWLSQPLAMMSWFIHSSINCLSFKFNSRRL